MTIPAHVRARVETRGFVVEATEDGNWKLREARRGWVVTGVRGRPLATADDVLEALGRLDEFRAR